MPEDKADSAIQGDCEEISAVLPKDNKKCIPGSYGIRMGKNGIQRMMIEVGVLIW